MTMQHKAILASAIVALLGGGTAYAQDTQNSSKAAQTTQPSSAKAPAQRKGSPEANSQANDSQAARAVSAAKPKAITLTNAERVLLQQRLRDEGFYHGKVDGKMDESTTRAIAAYQRKNGLVATGRPNNVTLSSLGIMASRAEPALDTTPKTAAVPPAPAAPRAENDGVVLPNRPIAQGRSEAVNLENLTVAQTRAIQEKLHRLGFYQGEIDGRAGPSTQRALSDYYQSQASLADQGKLRADSASTFDMDEDVQRVRGEERPAAKQKPAKGAAKKTTKTNAQTMERGLDNSEETSNDTGQRP